MHTKIPLTGDPTYRLCTMAELLFFSHSKRKLASDGLSLFKMPNMSGQEYGHEAKVFARA